ncbi:MAG: signal peptidase I [Capsulimonadales bacterium]|nr:signal peptidase I [Capsulimonadales bacterium]
MHPTLEARLAELREEEARKTRHREQVVRERRFLIPVFLFVLFLFPNLGTVSVVGTSMHPTLETGDRLLMLKTHQIFSPIRPGDIVVVRKADGSYKGEDLIKRVICVKDKQGNLLWAPSVKTSEGTIDPKRLFPHYVLRLRPFPKGSVLVLGDNIFHSTDSRDPEVGAISAAEIEGKVLFR